MDWRFIPFQRYDPFFKTGLNDALMDSVGNGGDPIVFVAGWDRKTVNVGRSQNIKKRVNLETAKEDGVTVVRRQGGGGTTFLTPGGEITWGVVAPDEEFAEDVNEIYRNRCQVIAEALSELGIEARHEPVNDVVTEKGKISGSTVRRRDGITYFGGTLLYEVDPEEMFRYIAPSDDKKKGKQIEDFEERVNSVKSEANVSFEEAREVLKQKLLEGKSYSESVITEKERLAAESKANKYRSDEWLYRK